MRRPMVFAAIALGSGAAAAFWLELDRKFWIGMLAFGCLVLLWNKTRSKVSVFLCIFLVGAMLMQGNCQYEDPMVKKAGILVTVTGIVTSIVSKDGNHRMTMQTGESRILVNDYNAMEDSRQLAGAKVTVSGELSLPQGQRNPKCFDYSLYLKTQGIRTIITADRVEIIETKVNAFTAFVYKIRGDFEEKLEGRTDRKTKGLLMAMLFGDKSQLDEELYEDFQKNGTAHILAVSGLHAGILYGFIFFLWRGRKGFIFHLSVMMILLIYVGLADFSPSVIRAAMMIALHQGARILHRRYDLLSAAAFTFIVMMCTNPMQLMHIGFQLSFLAIASLGVILPFIGRMYQGLFLSSLAIQMGMVPYTAYVFQYVSIGAIFVNVPIIFLTGILLPVGISTLVTSQFSQGLFAMGTEFLEQGCRILILINELAYGGGRTSFDVISPSIFVLAAYYGLMFMGICEKGRILFIRKKWREILAGAVVVLILAGITGLILKNDFSKAEIVFVDVGQGDCIHIKTREGKNYLIDGGGSMNYDVGKKTLKPYLLKNGVNKIDAAFATHLHKDHFDGIRSLAQEGMVKTIGLYDGNRVKELQLKKETGTDLLYLAKGQRVTLGKGVYLDILHPKKESKQSYEKMAEDEEDENASSLIMKLTYEGVTLLITGDIDQQGEEQLVDLYNTKLRADILKVAHHGSKYSSSEQFIHAVKPRIAVFQVGKNNFGHPAQAVIEKYRERGIIEYRNDTSGAIGISVEKGGRGISVQKMVE